MVKRLFNPITFLIIILLVFGVNASGQQVDKDEMINKMENAEKEFNKRQSQQLVAYMSLKTMFPDPKVRALAKAAGKGKISKIDKLIKEGVDVNARGTSNATPLFWPMRKNNLKGFTRLLEHGADPNVEYDDGGTVIHWAVIHKDERFLKAALKCGGNPNLLAGQDKEPPIFQAAGPDGKDKAGILLDAGADINARDDMGSTPVMVAAGLGQFDLVYELLERGADYTITTYLGYTLVDDINLSRSKNDPDKEKVIEWLEKRGVKGNRN